MNVTDNAGHNFCERRSISEFRFKAYKSQLPVIERALETAALMLGTDKSRGYCLEMICADFLAGASLENGDTGALVLSLHRLFQPHSCSAESRIPGWTVADLVTVLRPKRPRLHVNPEIYRQLRQRVLGRDP